VEEDDIGGPYICMVTNNIMRTIVQGDDKTIVLDTDLGELFGACSLSGQDQIPVRLSFIIIL